MSTADEPSNPTTQDPTTTETRVGNLTRDPVLRYSAKGAAWVTTAIAVDRRARDADGTCHDLPPEFYEIVCFGDLAENVATCLAKGDRVVIVGRIEEDIWTGRDGNDRATQKIVVDDIGASLRRGTVEVDRTRRSGPRLGKDISLAMAATTPEELRHDYQMNAASFCATRSPSFAGSWKSASWTVPALSRTRGSPDQRIRQCWSNIAPATLVYFLQSLDSCPAPVGSGPCPSDLTAYPGNGEAEPDRLSEARFFDAPLVRQRGDQRNPTSMLVQDPV